MGLVELVESSDKDDSDYLKKQFPDKSEYLNEKITYPYELFKSIDDHQKPVKNLEKKTSSVNSKTFVLLLKK